jgi:hypothetical protein
MSGASPVIRCLAAGLVALGLVLLCVLRISDSPIEKDPAQITLMAFNLERHGVMSMEETPPLNPTNYREPGPVFVFAAAIALIDAKLGKAATADAYYSGERVRLLKYQNLLWLLLLSGSAFWAARILGASFYVALLASVFVTYPFWGSHTPLDDLYTELPAAAFLMLGSATLALAFLRRPDTDQSGQSLCVRGNGGGHGLPLPVGAQGSPDPTGRPGMGCADPGLRMCSSALDVAQLRTHGLTEHFAACGRRIDVSRGRR